MRMPAPSSRTRGSDVARAGIPSAGDTSRRRSIQPLSAGIGAPTAARSSRRARPSRTGTSGPVAGSPCTSPSYSTAPNDSTGASRSSRDGASSGLSAHAASRRRCASGMLAPSRRSTRVASSNRPDCINGSHCDSSTSRGETPSMTRAGAPPWVSAKTIAVSTPRAACACSGAQAPAIEPPALKPRINTRPSRTASVTESVARRAPRRATARSATVPLAVPMMPVSGASAHGSSATMRGVDCSSSTSGSGATSPNAALNASNTSWSPVVNGARPSTSPPNALRDVLRVWSAAIARNDVRAKSTAG